MSGGECASCKRTLKQLVRSFKDSPTGFCRKCANAAHNDCHRAMERREHSDDCLKCAGECIRDNDNDLWWRMPNGAWAMDPLNHWDGSRDRFDGAMTPESIAQSYGPIRWLWIIIHEEEELIFA
jgi:hypothetical protein